MTVTILGVSVEATSGTLIFAIATVAAAVFVYRKMAPSVPATPGVPVHSIGERLTVAAAVAMAVVALGGFITAGATTGDAPREVHQPTEKVVR